MAEKITDKEKRAGFDVILIKQLLKKVNKNSRTHKALQRALEEKVTIYKE